MFFSTLFPEEVWQLRTEHATLLAGLRARVTAWGSGSRLGDLLTRLLADPRGSDVLRLYTSYANAFPEVLQTFHRLCRASPAFTRFLKVSCVIYLCTVIYIIYCIYIQEKYFIFIITFFVIQPQCASYEFMWLYHLFRFV